jgi:2-polyprenyl-6-methoxyphenol hydroxylase-like FAD-dependent oxidoreductase
MNNEPPDVLVVGAGPTGLSLALQANAHGARVRIVDRRDDVFRPSRALIMHPRTLEVLRPLGVTEALIAQGSREIEAVVHLRDRVVPVRLAELSMPDTSFPYLSLIRQTDVELVLAQALEERGVVVERGMELVDVEGRDTFAIATLQSSHGTERAQFTFVVGCDGQESTVRRCAEIAWPGAAYLEEAVLADVELDGDLSPGLLHVAVGAQGLVFAFAQGEQATWRLLATRPVVAGSFAFGQPGPAVPQSELQGLLSDGGLPAQIAELAWSARYRLQHRLADRFRKGPLLLAGDAAHAHSPATGQGMNTGIQDAINLGWKLAFSASSSDPETLLDSYEVERLPIARRLLALTHLVFLAEASSNTLLSLLRGVAGDLGAPILPVLAGHRALVTEVLRVLSQWRASYGASPLSVEGTASSTEWPRAGRRLPDQEVISGGHAVHLHELLAGPGVHLLGSKDVTGPRITAHQLDSGAGSGVLAIRPDGYIGFRGDLADDTQLRSWLALVGALN